MLPDAKFVVLLRNPVDRAFSHYQHSVQRGYEHLSFEDALASEPDRLAGEIERMQADERYDSHAHRAFTYFSRGIYVEQLLAWERFVPRDRLLVLESEALYSDPGAAYGEVLEFLGLDSWALPSFGAHERSRPGPELAAPTRAALEARYAPYNQALRDEFGLAFRWMA